jgi:L-ascorbate metabolism protein UlaG (beta-lactamase superfamily)
VSTIAPEGEPELVARLRARPPGDAVVLWWLGQSGFAIRFRDEMAVIDPYLSNSLTKKYSGTRTPHVRMKPNVLEPEMLARVPVTALLATHQHTDHLDADTLRPILAGLRERDGVAPLVAPEAWRAMAAERSGLPAAAIVGMGDGTMAGVGSFEVIGVASAHDRIEVDENGNCKYLGYVIRAGRWTLYHSGDTVAYEGLADRLRPFAIDLAVLPINGKVGNMSGADAARLAKDAGVRVVVPCHYDMFSFNTADPADAFVPECVRLEQRYQLVGLGESFTLA